MKIYFITLFAINIHNVLGPTPSVQERIAILKGKLLNDGHKQHPSIFDYYDDNSDDDDNQEFLLEPITTQRLNKRYKVARIITTPALNDNTTGKVSSPEPKRAGLSPVLKSQAKKKIKDKMFLNPMDIFYRRIIGQEFQNENWKWLQCQDMITPYLTGVKKDPTDVKKIGIKDAIPERLFHLLSMNMSAHAKDDTYALLHQISKIQIRLYQWDVMPIRVLLNLLVKGKAHTFRNLKTTMREMFDAWHLDFRNLTKIIEQTRIIRPPCTVTSQYSGSTKTATGSRYKEFTTIAKSRF